LEGCVSACRSNYKRTGITTPTSVRDEGKETAGRNRLNNSKLEDCEKGIRSERLSSLKCMYTNACSVVGKMDEVRYIAQKAELSIIGICETWANESINDAELNIDGYTLFRKDRMSESRCRGGGVSLYVKDTLRPRQCSRLNTSQYAESIWCIIDFADTSLLVGVCYRSTSSSEHNNDKLIELLQMAVEESVNYQLLLMGDFNYPEIDYDEYTVTAGEDSYPSKFFTCTQDLFLFQHVTEFTRCRVNQKPSVLDYLFTYDENSISYITYAPPLGKSDHCCLLFEYVVNDYSTTEFDSLKLNYWKGDFSSMIKDLGKIDWEVMFAEKTIEEMWAYFKHTMQTLCTAHIPRRSTNRKIKRRTWMTKATKKLLKKREEAWKRYREVCSTSNYENYKSLRNKVSAAIRKASVGEIF